MDHYKTSGYNDDPVDASSEMDAWLKKQEKKEKKENKEPKKEPKPKQEKPKKGFLDKLKQYRTGHK